ncbi:MAG: tRNA preQ1(34) S-adenosylmethionine ribosyltransferase-isomerase QueA [Planctomycetota bacterium]
MKRDELDFELPEELIARRPAAERAASRLLVVDPSAATWEHRGFTDFTRFLKEGDLLVLNDTKVVPARLSLAKTTGGMVEGLFLEEAEDGLARCMLSGGRLRPGVELVHREESILRLEEKGERGSWTVRNLTDGSWFALLDRCGSTPLPPYIRRLRQADDLALDSAEDRERYQTVWAKSSGSVAAPTASLHLDDAVLAELEHTGVELGKLTLHVGQGTFLPVESEVVEEHPMHAERFSVDGALETQIANTRARGGRVFAAGTTVCRALEAWALGHRGSTDLMILPGFEFQVVDGLLTNFHTPQSTLLALVAGLAQHQGAVAGLGFVKEVYASAVAERYRFFSYGDASLWLPACC